MSELKLFVKEETMNLIEKKDQTLLKYGCSSTPLVIVNSNNMKKVDNYLMIGDEKLIEVEITRKK